MAPAGRPAGRAACPFERDHTGVSADTARHRGTVADPQAVDPARAIGDPPPQARQIRSARLRPDRTTCAPGPATEVRIDGRGSSGRSHTSHRSDAEMIGAILDHTRHVVHQLEPRPAHMRQVPADLGERPGRADFPTRQSVEVAGMPARNEPRRCSTIRRRRPGPGRRQSPVRSDGLAESSLPQSARPIRRAGHERPLCRHRLRKAGPNDADRFRIETHQARHLSVTPALIRSLKAADKPAAAGRGAERSGQP